jgi:hypothetical protein
VRKRKRILLKAGTGMGHSYHHPTITYLLENASASLLRRL